ncbi:TDP-N-acetylfucosamine:lipid II N-acetylfucosaminyltransferase [Vibrio sp. 16]|uniref:TDP-N-acetylfucosamine:lipid II N-acetylfucosaminyltransferase n=1 Tax=Vibrio sp. 16 TaxID=391586 RepID=UPI00030B1E68|nr:TDP-N-acetylfucosamine:lipid II N-acetylfucosaminyltransferase [Vibrio sp. 16]CAK4070469.1 TDP-N-acetylfucosamine:lipid II N-acetylfucosaminyltransferase [Vibrio sp. 16]
MELEKFTPPIIDFLRKEFPTKRQQFFTFGDDKKYPYVDGSDLYYAGNYKSRIKKIFNLHFPLISKAYKCDKIVFHGLFDFYILLILFFNPWLLKKSYWIIMGGDLHNCLKVSSIKIKIKNVIRKFVFRNMSGLVTYIDGDVDILRKWCGAKGKYIRCLCYLTNTVSGVNQSRTKHPDSNFNVLLGNSADPSNNHLEIFEKIDNINNSVNKIVVPLTYGDSSYRDKVIEKGIELFGNKFFPIIEHLPLDDYKREIINTTDVAIFAHDRQQAMGNTISLLAMQKVVVMKASTPQYKLLKEIGVKVIDFETLSKSDLKCFSSFETNRELVEDFFSYDNLKNQWGNLL